MKPSSSSSGSTEPSRATDLTFENFPREIGRAPICRLERSSVSRGKSAGADLPYWSLFMRSWTPADCGAAGMDGTCGVVVSSQWRDRVMASTTALM